MMILNFTPTLWWDNTLNISLHISENTTHKWPKWEMFYDQIEIKFSLRQMDGLTVSCDKSFHLFTDLNCFWFIFHYSVFAWDFLFKNFF